MSDEIEKRLIALEAAHQELRLSNENTERKYNSLLAMVGEATAGATTASMKALAAAEKSLLASSQAATAAKGAAIAGALKVAETALLAARAAADAAGDASVAAMEAWKAALIIAGHDANPDNMQLSIKAHEASTAATRAAINALAVFTDAFEEVKKVSLG